MAELSFLKRDVGVPGAILLGMGSILGTGVFVSLGLGAGLAGDSVVVALLLAGVLASLNGLSAAQLSAAHPVSGGTYEYGCHFLSPRTGFAAGSLFLMAKSASAAAAAIGFASYLRLWLPWEGNAGAFLALALITVVVCLGVKRSVQLNALLVLTTVGALLVFVGYCALSGVGAPPPPAPAGNFWESVALMFVAFTGYGRIATMSEEVVRPRRTIPIAVIVCLLLCCALYVAVASGAIKMVGAREFYRMSLEGSPLEIIASRHFSQRLAALLSVGACLALLGVLLNLLLGLSRVILAMSRRGDLPKWFSKLDVHRNPSRAVLLCSAIIGLWVAVGTLESNWEFSAFTVLVYYGITNAAALRLRGADRLYPGWVPVLGGLGCLGLAFFIDIAIALRGLGILAAAFVAREVWLRWKPGAQ